MENVEGRIEKLIDLLVLKIPEVVAAILILFIGRYLVKFILRILDSRFQKRNLDISIRGFITSLLKFVLYALLILTVASTLGIETTSFIAALSAFGLAVGMALQGSLSNFAGGVLILVFRPFEVGDYISSANGSSGTVEKIDLLYTTMLDDNGICVFSPNGTLANSVIKNFTKIQTRRIQFTFLLSYDANVKVTRETILNIINEDVRIVKTPLPVVQVGDLKDGGIELIIRAWVARENYWTVKTDLAEKLQSSFDAVNVSFPQSSIKVLHDEN
ncbi:mechanosensitive ion channel family protein [Sphingobacterium bovistauri]|uniref:Mechanosensitive ion channel n=1 Tax=Sphingobacterium bovistauri TaxID=2781959 RepID=A0ABS7Z8L8_9SPHI|nr:mechanosensitive ion channel domain-containing protein [Sphingobacterium bovistauri]MCA5006499.1 mechanosensitive ion channel [Sphingobacterium bovistauri]